MSGAPDETRSRIRGPAILPCFVAAAIVSTTAGAQSGPGIEAVRFEQPPVIDGKLDDAAWSSAPVVSGFIQFEPIRGEPSPLATEVRLGHDDEALYLAFRCRDDEPDRIAASVTARDGDFDDDDSVIVMLDTFHDGTSGYYFGTNVLGTQFDGTLTNNGRTVDGRWDAAWTNATTRDESGWIAEFRIPFEVLRYATGDDRTWGVNFQRISPRRLETSLWAGPGESEWRVSEFGTLSALQPPGRVAKWWEIKPYVLGSVDEDGEATGEVGGDVRLRASSNLLVDLTVNPDFALIEADVETVNLTRFELFVPEKRPFFLEGNERFSQRIRQFYSRRIGDIDWGGKATGTVGGVDFVAMAARSELEEPPDDADYGVLRLQKSVMKSGNVGLLAASRQLEGENAGSIGLDTTLFFTKTIGMTAQYLQSHGAGSEGSAWFVRPAYDSNTLHFHLRYTNLDEGIQDDINAVGFMRDDNRREFDTNLTHTWWFESAAVEKLRAGVTYNRYNGQDGVLRSYVTDVTLRMNFTNRWNVDLGYVDEYKRFEEEYYNELAVVEVGWDNRSGREFSLEVSKGVNFGDDLWLYEANANVKLSDAWNLSYDFTLLDLTPDLDDLLLQHGPLPEAVRAEQHVDRQGERPGADGLAHPAAVRLAAGRVSARDVGARHGVRAGGHAVHEAVLGVLRVFHQSQSSSVSRNSSGCSSCGV